LNTLIADKRIKAENFYKNEHNVKLSKLSLNETEKAKEKKREKDTLLCTYYKNFQLALLDELVKLNSWRDVEIITSLPITYLSMRMDNDKNESIIDAKWHPRLCRRL
jgi:hypothetical protein